MTFTYRIVPDGQKILAMAGVKNAHQLALRAQVSYPTIERYINSPETSHNLSCEVMGAIILRGIGLTKEQALDMRIGDLFKIVELKHATPDNATSSSVDPG